MNKLLILADFLEKLNPHELDMCMWTNDCGTVRCAAGWAQMIWPEELRFEHEKNDDGQIVGVEICHQHYRSFYALAIFFEIPWNDASDLFGIVENRGLTLQEIVQGFREYVADISAKSGTGDTLAATPNLGRDS